jgi:hypothetical protein
MSLKKGDLREKHAVATWNLGNISAFAWTQRKSQENLCRSGRSQDLPDAYWLLLDSSSANKRMQSLTWVL